MATLTLNPVARHELKIFGWLAAAFAAIYFLPVGTPRFDGAVTEALELTKWYAREHVVLCLLPAFWIAGAIAAFVSQASVMRYLGPDGAEAAGLRRRLGVRDDSRGLQLHGAAAVPGHLPHGCRPRSGHRVPVFGAGDQRAGDRHDGQGARRAARHRPGRGCGLVRRRHRPADGDDLPPRGAGRRLRRRRRCRSRRPVGRCGRRRRSSRCRWASSCSRTGVPPSQTTGFFAAVYAIKWWLTSALGVTLARAAVALVQDRAAAHRHGRRRVAAGRAGRPGPSDVALPRRGARAGLAHGRPRRRGGRVVQPGVELHEADRAAAAGGRAGRGLPARSAGPRGPDSVGVDQRARGRQLRGGQPVRGGVRRVHVLRHTDRSPDRAGPGRQWHGRRAVAGVAAGRASAQPAEHDRAQLDSRPRRRPPHTSRSSSSWRRSVAGPTGC